MAGTKKSTTSKDIVVGCLSFGRSGPANTDRTLEAAARRARELGVRDVLVATTTGATAVKALRYIEAAKLAAVTHSTGFSGPNVQELKPALRRRLEKAGVRILTAQHAFGGVGRAVRKKLGTYELEEIVAYALRTFGQGTKVAIEISLMAADAGLVAVGEPCVAVGGTWSGADTALVVIPSNAQSFFDLRVVEVVAKPR